MDEPKGFYVEPKYDCPHIDEAFKADEKLIAATAPCTTCNDEKENWACLTCSKRFCSRYINAHMQAHNTETGHPICTSYSDLSIWCYSCDSYIADPRFTNLLKQMGVAKFGDAGTGGRYTAHSTKEQMEEKYDSPKILKKKIQKLAALIKKSKHFIAFTGAGISTSAGIPDFRGPQGVWTLKATGQRRTAPTVNFLSALPSVCHMALVGLAQAGKLKYTISQNVDGLHRRSGISPTDLAELHGNTNLEICSKCCKEYMRDFECMKGGSVNHVTARKCSVEECGGELLDTIINFGESLPIHYLQGGFEESNKADLCLVLGSSLGVTPAADMPKVVGKKKYGDLVIVNLQKTPLDKLASIRIFGKCDEVMEMLMKELEIDIPPFILKRTVIISHDENQIKVEGIDVDGTPLSLFCGVEAEFSNSDRKQPIDAQDGPFHFPRKENDGNGVKVTLHFFGHYNEPPYTLDYNISDSKGAKKFLLQFDPEKGIWTHEEEEATEKDLSQGKGGQDDMMKKYPTQVEDERHEEHPLKLLPSVYGGVGYRCNACLRTGQGWVYTCEECQYDLHPACAIWRRGAKNN